MKRLAPILLLSLVGCSAGADSIVTQGRFRAEVWADNWFSFHLGETAIAEDSVSITTERSFNKEVFGFDGTYPLVLNFVVKDYKKNDTGLEYIGTPQQQMGDGGFIAQIKDTTTGRVIAVTNAGWRCLVVHQSHTTSPPRHPYFFVHGQCIIPPLLSHHIFLTLQSSLHACTGNFHGQGQGVGFGERERSGLPVDIDDLLVEVF
jgi:hypothetical protein